MYRFLAAALAATLGWGVAVARQLETFATLESAWDVDIAPDASKVAIGCSPRGVREVCVYDLIGGGRPQLIPAPEGARITGLFWPSPTHLLVSFQQFDRVTLMNSIEDVRYNRLLSWNAQTRETTVLLREFGGAMDDLTDVSSVLAQHDDKVAMEVSLVSGGGGTTGSNLTRDASLQTVVFEVDLDRGRETGTLYESSNSQQISRFVLDATGRVIAEEHRRPNDIYQIRLPGSREPVFEGQYEFEVPHVYGALDQGGALAMFFPGGEGLMRLDLGTGERTSFGEDLRRSDAIIDQHRSALVGFSGVGDLPGQRFIDEELAGIHAALSGALSEESVVLTTWTPSRTHVVAAARDRGRPATYYLYDRAAGSVGVLATEYDQLAGFVLGNVERIDYAARDGLELPAYLTLPPGTSRADGPFPLIVMPHGGPFGRDTAAFDWWSQAYASLGYAVLMPQFRGSAGFGQAFIEAGYGEFGNAMITDIIDGARHLEAEGIASPQGYCLAGASYGGYAAMMAALDDAGGAGCAISVAGVSDPIAYVARYRRWESFVDYWERYMGSRFQGREQIRALTPRDRATELGVPVLLFHGEEDVQVPPIQSEWFAEAAAHTGLVRLIELEGENHYLGSAAARAAILTESAAFLEANHPAHR